METLDLKTGEGNVKEAFLFDLQADLGSFWNNFVQSNLNSNGDGFSGGQDDGEWLDGGKVNAGWFCGSI